MSTHRLNFFTLRIKLVVVCVVGFFWLIGAGKYLYKVVVAP